MPTRRRYCLPPTGATSCAGYLLGDLKHDGNLAAVLAASAGRSILARLGIGDGDFGPRGSERSGPGPFDVTLTDVLTYASAAFKVRRRPTSGEMEALYPFRFDACARVPWEAVGVQGGRVSHRWGIADQPCSVEVPD